MLLLRLEILFVLVRPIYAGNVGSVARVIKNFGFKNLILIKPTRSIEDEAYIMAVHAKDILESAKIYDSIHDFLRKEKINYVIGTTARLGGDKNPKRNAIFSHEIRKYFPSTGRIAILFGNEETGLTNNELKYCNLLVTIPTSEEYRSMNLSHAVAVIAYELSLLRKKFRKVPYRPAELYEKRILINYMLKIADIVLDHFDENKKRIYKQIICNWIERIFLTGREVHSLIGFVRMILARLQGLRNKKYGD